ncbi:hypothetical protein SNE40_019141 [Patella caerulea]|uniref:Protein sleepless n=1 Tax=Patella caerulea TaxID=87958 RepID=A0AAN8J8Q7_PATCE
MTKTSLEIRWKIYLVCFSLLFLAGTGDAMECFQCNSTLDSNCQDQFDHSIANHPQKSKYCKMHDAKFCIKVTGLWGGVVGTHRFCSSRDMGDQCQDIGYMDHDRMYRACTFTCSSDGCNASTKLSLSATLMSMTIGVLAFISS